MQTISYIYLTDGTSGKIVRYPLSTYTATTGWAACKTGEDTATAPNTYWRAFFQFDTSGILGSQQVENVSFIVSRAKVQPYGDPDTYELRFSIGDIIGGALDGNVAEWDAGTLAAELDERPLHSDLIDLGAVGIAAINKSGNTDVKAWDNSTQGPGGNPSWGFDFNRKTGLGSKCGLRIVLSVPSASVIGRGFASCAAEVTHAASASVVGQGLASLAGYVEHDASASSVGRGFASLEGTIERVGAGTAVGRGFASLEGTIERVGAATLVGRGFASLEGFLYIDPLALHVRTVAVSAADTATVEAIPVDAATIAVASIDSASLVVVSQDTATITVDPDDVATRGQRRN
jgi:hypothetical protein